MHRLFITLNTFAAVKCSPTNKRNRILPCFSQLISELTEREMGTSIKHYKNNVKFGVGIHYCKSIKDAPARWQ